MAGQAGRPRIFFTHFRFRSPYPITRSLSRHTNDGESIYLTLPTIASPSQNPHRETDRSGRGEGEEMGEIGKRGDRGGFFFKKKKKRVAGMDGLCGYISYHKTVIIPPNPILHKSPRPNNTHAFTYSVFPTSLPFPTVFLSVRRAMICYGNSPPRTREKKKVSVVHLPAPPQIMCEPNYM